MADKKISELNNATLPLTGTELIPIVQDGETVKVEVSEVGSGGSAGTLQQVTDNGNTTTNDITAGGFLSLGNANIPGINFNDAEDLDTSLGFLGADPSITTPRNWVLPDTSGTIALKENTIPITGTETGNPITGDLSYGQLDGVARKITFKDSNDYNFDLTFGNDGSELGEPKVIGFYATDDTVFGKIGLDPAFNPFIQVGDGTYFGKFTFNAVQTIHFISDNPLCAGIDGNIDYSDNYTPTCFVQKVYVDTKLKQTEATTGAVISFANPQVYNTYTTPTSSNITNDLTGAKIGIVQKIYSNKATEPTYPAGWVKLSGTYTNSVTNIIYAEWCEGSRVEYWIVKA